MDSYVTVKQRSSFEYEDRKSVFIGEAMPVSSEVDALAFIESVRKKYSDARHHVYAYVLRDNSIARFTDDHEPQGTAGMPILDVIRKKGLTDIVIVVTRYFGGTLLGTGGLVRAYTSAAAGAIENAEIVTYDVYSELAVTVGYSDYGKLATKLSELSFFVEDTDFSESVCVIGKIPKRDLEALYSVVTELTSGRAEYELLGEKYDCI